MSGILPRELEHAAGGPVYNLGLPSLQPEGVVAMLPDLEGMPELRTIVLGVSPFSLFDSEIFASFRGYARRELWPRRPGYLFEFPYLIRDSSDFVRHALDASPLFRVRYRLNGSAFPGDITPPFPGRVIDVLFAGAGRRAFESRRIAALLERERGHWSWNFVGEDPGQCPTEPPRIGVFPGTLRYPDRVGADAAYRRLLGALTARYDVYLVELPLSETWHGVVDAQEVYGRIDARVASWRADFPGLRVIPRPAHDAYTGADFIDWTHLSYCGARRYTRGLVRALR
jgi:hypothetical protein